MYPSPASDEPSHPDSPREGSAPVRHLWMSPGNSRALTYEVLQAEWERVEDRLPERLGLRVHRALSWLERAEREPDDPDAAFVFYWIAFNAAYAQDRPRSLDSTERNHFSDFFDTILSLDSGHAIYDAIWERFSDSIRVLLDNRFVFQPFWNHHAGRGHENWEHAFERSKRGVQEALAAPRHGCHPEHAVRPVVRPSHPAHARRCLMAKLSEPRPGPGWCQNSRLPCTPVRWVDDVTPGYRLGAA